MEEEKKLTPLPKRHNITSQYKRNTSFTQSLICTLNSQRTRQATQRLLFSTSATRKRQPCSGLNSEKSIGYRRRYYNNFFFRSLLLLQFTRCTLCMYTMCNAWKNFEFDICIHFDMVEPISSFIARSANKHNKKKRSLSEQIKCVNDWYAIWQVASDEPCECCMCVCVGYPYHSFG